MASTYYAVATYFGAKKYLNGGKNLTLNLYATSDINGLSAAARKYPFYQITNSLCFHVEKANITLSTTMTESRLRNYIAS